MLIPGWLKLAAIGAAATAIVGLWWVDRAAQFDRGRETERAIALAKAIEIMKQKAKDDAEIQDMDTAGLCREFGFRLQPDGRCG